MKRNAVLLGGIVCVLFVAATASAGPPHRKSGRAIEQIARPVPHRVVHETMDHAKKARPYVARQTTRQAPHIFQKPRVKGDLFGENQIRRATATHYGTAQASRAADQLKRMAEAKIQPTVSCMDGTNCGKVKFGSDRARMPIKHKITSSLAKPEERQQSYLKQVWQYRMDKRAMPEKLKELESGCNDFAACL